VCAAGLTAAAPAAFAAAAAVGPGLAALAMFGVPQPKQTPAEKPAPAKPSKKAAKKSAPVDKRKTAEEPAPEPQPVSAAAGSDLAVTLAVAPAPFPFAGPFIAMASVIVPPLFSGLKGVVLAVALLVVWASVAWALGRDAASRSGAVPSTGATFFGALGCLAGPAVALALTPWAATTDRGWAVIVFGGLIPWGALFVAFAKAKSSPVAVPAEATAAPATSTFFERGARAAAVVDTILSLPLGWIDALVARQAPAATPARPVDPDADEEAS
ncbi:MAG: hypothetical protein HOW73_17440, partial [Polyangiaceae bacterium]|nr:hypothetical protein [Polyangiaceae bacterium]